MIIAKYIFFALLASGLNLFTQFLSLSLYSGKGNIYMAIALGTLAGLIGKYILDKKYIFNYLPQTRVKDVQKFLAYSVTGGVTTLIFWGSELLFHYAMDTDYAKYLGGALGLTIGYIIKFNMDKKYVFG